MEEPEAKSKPFGPLPGAQGRRYCREPFERHPDPEFYFDITYVEGAEGELIETAQAQAIKELLQWVQQKQCRP